jgi:hypothetical protein
VTVLRYQFSSVCSCDVRLHETTCALGVEPRAEQPDRHLERALRERGSVVALRDSVLVDDAEQAVVLLLELDPVLDRAQVVADVQLT